ncbi:hypothetical protein J2X46_004166 [Nocardioides sp. BE266]|nr:hypothetical protein [Nocardioides sp. BE266]
MIPRIEVHAAYPDRFANVWDPHSRAFEPTSVQAR